MTCSTLQDFAAEMAFFCSKTPYFRLGLGHGKLEKAAHQKALEKSLGIKDQSCQMLRLSHKAMW